MADRARIIQFMAKQVVRSLEVFIEPKDQDFALEEVITAARALRSQTNTGKYHIDFQDEPPTKPDGSNPSDRPALQKMRKSVRAMQAVQEVRESERKKDK